MYVLAVLFHLMENKSKSTECSQREKIEQLQNNEVTIGFTRHL